MEGKGGGVRLCKVRRFYMHKNPWLSASIKPSFPSIGVCSCLQPAK